MQYVSNVIIRHFSYDRWFCLLRLILAISALLFISGCEMRQCLLWCHDSTDVQRTYVSARDECQDLAEDKVHLFLPDYPAVRSEKEVSAALLALFAKCMHIKDWGVTAPKQEASKPITPVVVPQLRQNEARAGFGIGPGFGDVVPNTMQVPPRRYIAPDSHQPDYPVIQPPPSVAPPSVAAPVVPAPAPLPAPVSPAPAPAPSIYVAPDSAAAISPHHVQRPAGTADAYGVEREGIVPVQK